MPRKSKGGNNVLPDMHEIQSLYDLDYSKAYQEFNYDKHINNIKQSNFAGGCYKGKLGTHKLSHLLVEKFDDFKKGKCSFLKKYNGGYQFPVTLKDMQNISDLNYQTPFEYQEIKRLQTVPYSKFSF